MGMTMLVIPTKGQGNNIPDSIRQLLSAATTQKYETQVSLSLKDAQEYAIQQNRSLQNASLEVKKAHAQRWQTIAAMLPQANGTAQYTNMCGYEMDFQGMKMAMPPYVSHSVTASIGLSAQGIIGILLNNLAIEMQDITREQSEDNLRANVTETYISVLVLEDIAQLLDSSLKNVESLAKQTQRMAEVGTVEQTQADQIQVRVNTLRNQVSSTKRNITISYNALRVLLDVSAETELILTERLEDLTGDDKILGVLMENFDINNNHNYQLLSKSVELAQKNLSMAKWAYAPTLGASYIYTAKKYMSDAKTFNMQPPHTVAAQVSIPLWSSGKRAAAITEQKIALQEARNTFSETSDNLSIQHQQLRYNLVNAYETFVNERDNIHVTKRVMDNITNKYNWGAASSLELTNASNDLISAQSSYVNAVLTMVKAQIELENFLNNK